MSYFEKNDEKANSPKKTFNFLQEDKEKDRDIDKLKVYYKAQNNFSFSSPLSKKIFVNDHSGGSKSYNDNKNNIYSPYVKRIDISGNKIDSDKDNNNIQNTCFTSYKKITKKFYSPSPNLIKSEKLSDRFIPLNKGINLMEKFNLTTKFKEVDENKIYNDINREETDNKDLYNEMLKTNFLNEYNSSSLINKLNIVSSNNNNKDIIPTYYKSKIFSWKKENNFTLLQ